MRKNTKFLGFASASAMALALSHAGLALEITAEATAPAGEAVPPTPVASQIPAPSAAQAAATSSAAAAQAPKPPTAAADNYSAHRAYLEKRMKKRWEDRNRRYRELRERAKEVGMELPETPPWETTQPPEPPAPPSGWLSYDQMRERMDRRGVEIPPAPPAGTEQPPQAPLVSEEERRELWNKMKNMTPEEREAVRLEHYQKVRQRAAERGVELPETPPWKRWQEARSAAAAAAEDKWAEYRKTIAGMTPEERAACHAMQHAAMPRWPSSAGSWGMPRRWAAPAGAGAPRRNYDYGYGRAPYGQTGAYGREAYGSGYGPAPYGGDYGPAGRNDTGYGSEYAPAPWDSGSGYGPGAGGYPAPDYRP